MSKTKDVDEGAAAAPTATHTILRKLPGSGPGTELEAGDVVDFSEARDGAVEMLIRDGYLAPIPGSHTPAAVKRRCESRLRLLDAEESKLRTRLEEAEKEREQTVRKVQHLEDAVAELADAREDLKRADVELMHLRHAIEEQIPKLREAHETRRQRAERTLRGLEAVPS
jgi:septal ring factor EnvC (AmiA/AmiB activator)